MSNFVIDAHAWIEYFNGSKSGEDIRKLIENKNNSIFISIIIIAELSNYFKRKGLSFDEAKRIILSISSIYELNVNFAEEVGSLHAEMKKERKNIGLADIFVLLTARKLGAKVVTGDADFQGLKDVILIK